MSRIAVARLSLTVPEAALAVRGRFLAEEALRCAGEDRGARFLVIRRLRLGVLPGGSAVASQVAWTTRTSAVLRAQAGAAVHALAPGAEAAGAVWFASEAEARAALVRLLALGRRPYAWFWPLAAPEWHGGTWQAAAPALLRKLTTLPGGRPALARVVVAALASGDAPALLAPLGDALVEALVPARLPDRAVPRTGAVPIGRRNGTGEAEATVAARVAAVRALAALAPPADQVLARLVVALGPASPRARFLAVQVVLAAAPELGMTPPLLSEAAATLCEVAVARHGVLHSVSAPDTVSVEAAAGVAPSWDLPAQRSAAAPGAPEAGPARRHPSPPMPVSRRQADTVASVTAVPSVTPLPFVSPGSRSVAAGLFLLIRPLVWLGLPSWLEIHPHHAVNGFAWGLLHAIAVRMHVSAGDAVWPVLDEALGLAVRETHTPTADPNASLRAGEAEPRSAGDEDAEGDRGRFAAPSSGAARRPLWDRAETAESAAGESQLPRHDRPTGRAEDPPEDRLRPAIPTSLPSQRENYRAAQGAWRVGLDRWLRRRVGITLAETVRRPGWLLADPAQVTARFPLHAADVRLRRLALDVDPGWVPWLGRSISYVYRDTPADLLRDTPATHLAFAGRLTAPAGTRVVTSLTTLAETPADRGEATSRGGPTP